MIELMTVENQRDVISVYEMKSSGPSMEPCGTLQVTGIGLDITLFAQKV